MSKTDKINEFLSSYTADPAKYEGLSAEEILNVAIKNFSPKIAFASSFGAEDVVIIDMLHKIHGDNARVFTLDTGRLNPETYDVMDRIRKKYSINIETMF